MATKKPVSKKTQPQTKKSSKPSTKAKKKPISSVRKKSSKPTVKKKPVVKRRKRQPPRKKITAASLEAVVADYDLSKLKGKLLEFAKAYLVCGQGYRAAKVITTSRNDNYLRVLGSQYLTRLRSHPWFLPMLGMGWDDFARVVKKLKAKPKHYSDIFLKLNREDVTAIDIKDERSVINIVKPPVKKAKKSNKR